MTSQFQQLRQKVAYYRSNHLYSIQFTSLVLSYMQLVTLAVFAKQFNKHAADTTDTDFATYIAVYLLTKLVFLFCNEILAAVLFYTVGYIILAVSKNSLLQADHYREVFWMDWVANVFTLLLLVSYSQPVRRRL